MPEVLLENETFEAKSSSLAFTTQAVVSYKASPEAPSSENDLLGT